MKVLLLRVPVLAPLTITPPLGLGFLASALKKQGMTVRILDGVKSGTGIASLVRYVDMFSPQMVGLSLMTTDLGTARQFVEVLSSRFPGIPLVVGGPHVSALPEHPLQSLGVAYGIAGEAEHGLVALARHLQDDSLIDEAEIPGLIYRTNGSVSVNPAGILEDLDSLGPPAWELLQPETYPPAPLAGFARRFPVAPLLLTRGCPWRCRFCSAHVVHHRKVRCRSVAGIIEEVLYLQKAHGIREFHFIDDNFAVGKKQTLALCQALSELRPKPLWCVPQGIRLDSVDEEVAEALVQGGCYRVLAGLESGSERVLERMEKQISLEEAESRLWILKRVGLRVGANFIIGYPGERREDVEKSIAFARRLPLDYCSFTAFVPYPGSAVFDELLAEGRVSLKTLPDSDMYFVERSYTEHLTAREIKSYRLRAYLTFFLRPGPLFHLVTEVRSLGHLKMVLRRAWVHMRHLAG